MGVEVEVTRPGTGKTFPQKGSRCPLRYVGTMAASGKKFHASHDRLRSRWAPAR